MHLKGSLYIEHETVLHGLNPFTKICLAILLLTAVFALPWPWTTWLIALVLAGPVAFGARVGKPLLRAMAILYLPFCGFLFFIHGLFHPAGGEELARIWLFSIQKEPLLYALRIAGRVGALFTVSCLLVMTTHPGRLMKDLQSRGLHWSIAYIFCATLQILPLMRMRADSIRQAQQARGLDTTGSLRTRIKALFPLAGPLVYGAVMDVEDRALALESRAIMRPGKRHFLEPVPDSGAQRVARWCCLLLALGLTGYRIWLLSR